MNYQGSCVAVYSPGSYQNIIKVIKTLQAINFSDKQLSVMGKRVNGKSRKSRLPNLIKPFHYYGKREVYFWDNLKDLLRGKNNIETSGNCSIEVTGELSRVNLKNKQIENNNDFLIEINNLLNFVGIPEVSFEHYKTVLKNGQLLLIIRGNYQELKRAGKLLDLSGNINVSLHLTNTR